MASRVLRCALALLMLLVAMAAAAGAQAVSSPVVAAAAAPAGIAATVAAPAVVAAAAPVVQTSAQPAVQPAVAQPAMATTVPVTPVVAAALAPAVSVVATAAAPAVPVVAPVPTPAAAAPVAAAKVARPARSAARVAAAPVVAAAVVANGTAAANATAAPVAAAAPVDSSAPISCGACVNGACVKDAASGMHVCVCHTGFWGSECQYGPGGGGVCAFSASVSSGNVVTALQQNTWFAAAGWKLSSDPLPALPCGANGKCNADGRCVCSAKHIGSFCQRAPCPNDCSMAGYCLYPAPDFKPTCKCLYGASGEDCSIGGCKGCSGHGTCHQSASSGALKCKCEAGYAGEFCEKRACPSCGVHGVCDEQKYACRCEEGFTGPTCEQRTCPKACSGHGSCDAKTGKCLCASAWTGADCSVDADLCPNNCSGAGRCTKSGCVCNANAAGKDCSQLSCPSDCSGHGKCKGGKCLCDAEYTGADCSAPACGKNNCNGNGVCRNGQCMCAQPFTGKECDKVACPNQCSGNGVCDSRTGVCSCYTATQLAAIYPTDGPEHEFGFTGKDCSLKQCFSDCGAKDGRGSCNSTTGLCECAPGFWGAEGMHCNSVLCSEPCSNHGFCVDNKCVCDVAPDRRSGWTGEKCEKPVCPNHCFQEAGLGRCVDGACKCAPGWYGDDCSQKACPMNYSPLAWIGAEKVMCAGHGACVEGGCVCLEDFSGSDCSVRLCPGLNANGTTVGAASCSGHGTCQPNGACVCDAGFKGEDCFERVCTSDCGQAKGRGVCDGETGVCECAEGWFGADCSAKRCSDSCNGNGQCLDDACVCKPGFQGLHCELPICGNNCSFAEGQGRCVNNQCVCNPGFNGVECLYKDCPLTVSPLALEAGPLVCSGNGACVAGACVCNAAWSGDDCTTRACPHNCSDVGSCSAQGVCTCPLGDAQGRGGFIGKFCEKELCPNNCGETLGQGVCVAGKCVCTGEFAGPDCMFPQCPLAMPALSTPFSRPVPCGGAGDCVKGACVCQPGFTGPDCSHRPCLNDCTDAAHGTCQSNGQCKCTDKFMGADCSTLGCPEGCSGHGACMGNGVCKCDARWTGSRCEIVKCPNGCSDAGQCVRLPATASSPPLEKCVCDPGFQGADCSQPICLPLNEQGQMCKGKGHCVVDHSGRHVCRCTPPYFGADCGNAACNSTCNFHGVCAAAADGKPARCECDEGWFGENCERTGDCLPSDCFGRGKCVAGPKSEPLCQCQAPFGGPDCSLCMHDCGGHGTCTPNGCVCQDGWQGPLCDRREDCDPKDCGGKGHGTCVADANGQPVCKCNFPWTDFDCMECTLTCNEHGNCNAQGGCTCDAGWKGEMCDRFGDCPNHCSERGTCVGDDIGDPVCRCQPGYGGLDCGQLVCNATCPAHSTCLDNECTCLPGWTGDACDVRDDCPNNCGGRGVCMADAKNRPFCKCELGRAGAACEFQACEQSCSEHGSCVVIGGKQRCKCDKGWGGVDCEVIDCAVWDNCGGSSHGECGLDVKGNPKCICVDPYTGSNCTDVKCNKQHCIHGTCANEKCVCEAGWKGEKCDYRVPCPAPGCGDSGKCVGDAAGVGKCLCEEGFTGENCQDVLCDDKCSGNGQCVNLGCVCRTGFHGSKCEITAPCPSGCSGHGECNYDSKNKRSVCDCEDMWDSPASPAPADCSVPRGKTWMDAGGKMQYQCNEPYYGGLCQKKRCALPCQNGGLCAEDGLCDCPSGWKGEDCSTPVCPKACSGGGECDLAAGQCRCFYGYSGPGCEVFSPAVCLASCSFKCSIRGAGGLVSVFDQEGLAHWVSARQCHEMCEKPELCNVLFGSGHQQDGRTYVTL